MRNQARRQCLVRGAAVWRSGFVKSCSVPKTELSCYERKLDSERSLSAGLGLAIQVAYAISC